MQVGYAEWTQHPVVISLTLQGTTTTPHPPPTGDCEGVFRHLSLADQSHLSIQRHRASACSILNYATCWMGSSSSMVSLSLPCS